MFKMTAAVVTTLAIALTSACGGGDGDAGRPSVEEISKSFTSSDSVIPVPEAAADCVAEVFHDSKLSDETLRALVDQDKGYKGSTGDTKTLTSLTSAMTKDCADELAK